MIHFHPRKTQENEERAYFLQNDGWNPVAEYTGAVHTTGTPPALTLVRTHLWGTDLSGSLQGAGGVGGLLGSCLFNGGGSRYYPTYDGNGNVSEYLVGTTVVAHYEYDPFGNDITPAAKRGKLHNSFPFRFSTKYQDFESGMYEYGGREYESFTGRWPNHDPIGERGGINLFQMVHNDPISFIDILGHQAPMTAPANSCGLRGLEWIAKLTTDAQQETELKKGYNDCEDRRKKAGIKVGCSCCDILLYFNIANITGQEPLPGVWEYGGAAFFGTSGNGVGK